MSLFTSASPLVAGASTLEASGRDTVNGRRLLNGVHIFSAIKHFVIWIVTCPSFTAGNQRAVPEDLDICYC